MKRLVILIIFLFVLLLVGDFTETHAYTDRLQPINNSTTSPIEMSTIVDIPLDIVLVQDETGSMGDDISALKALAPQIWDNLVTVTSAEFRMSVIGFRDYAYGSWGSSGDWVYRLNSDFTSDKGYFVNGVNLLTASGGSDTPEAQYPTLYYLLNSSHPCIDSNRDGDCSDVNDTLQGLQPNFRSGAQRVILLATDAPFHDPLDTSGYPGPNRDTVLNALLSNRVIVIGLVPGGQGRIEEVDDLATITGGSTQDTGASGEDVVNAILDALNAIKPVSPDFSTVTIIPSTLPADGMTSAYVNILLRDTENRPVQGKRVLLYSDRGDVDIITQPLLPTDINGSTTGEITSISPGISNIRVIDVTDNVQLSVIPTVEFTDLGIPPTEEMSNCINLLDRLSRQELQTLNSLAYQNAEDAEYFSIAIGKDKAKIVSDSIWAFVNVGIPATNQAANAVGWKLPGFLRPDWGASAWLKSRHPDAGEFINLELMETLKTGDIHIFPARALNDGLLFYGARLANSSVRFFSSEMAKLNWNELIDDNSWDQLPDHFVPRNLETQEALEEYKNLVIVSIPPMTDEEQQAYAFDLCKRSMVPYAIASSVERQSQLAHNLRDAHESTGGGGITLFILKFIGSNASYIMWDGVGKIVFDGITHAFDLYIDSKKLDASQRGFANAFGFFQNGPGVVADIYSNAYDGLERVHLGIPPQTITGEIVSIRQYEEGSFWSTHSSYVDVEIQNTSDSTSNFYTIVEYGYNSKLLGLPWVYTPIVKQAEVSITPHDVSTVRIYFKNEEEGGSPDDNSWVSVYVLAGNEKGKFNIGFHADPWNPTRVSYSTEPILSETDTISIPVVDNPIDLFVFNDLENQLHEGVIWISNPFTNTITAQITQPLPLDIYTYDTQGEITPSSIAWEKTISASDVVSVTFSFKSSSSPGTLLNLPPATMAFIEPSSGLSLSTVSNSTDFLSLDPLEISGYVPFTLRGLDAFMTIKIKSLVDIQKIGSIDVNIYNRSGELIFEESSSFSVLPFSDESLIFRLPGSLDPGNYPIEVYSNIDGIRQKIISDFYSINDATVKIAYLPMILKDYSPPIIGFNSQFNGSSAGWVSHAGTWSVTSDYYGTTGLPEAFSSASYDQTYSNLDYRVKFMRDGCEECANSIIIRGVPTPFGDGNRWNSGYSFNITRNGFYSVVKYTNGVGSMLQGWAYSPAINTSSSWNTLRAAAIGPNLYFYINGTLVWSGSDASYASGRVGIAMYRTADSTGDQLWADWATLDILSAAATQNFDQEMISVEQEGLNTEASRNPDGDDRKIP